MYIYLKFLCSRSEVLFIHNQHLLNLTFLKNLKEFEGIFIFFNFAIWVGKTLKQFFQENQTVLKILCVQGIAYLS